MLQVVEGADLAKENWQQFLRQSQGVDLEEVHTAGFAVEGVSMQASLTTGVFSLTTGVFRGWRHVQTLQSTQATVRRAGPPCYNT